MGMEGIIISLTGDVQRGVEDELLGVAGTCSLTGDATARRSLCGEAGRRWRSGAWLLRPDCC